MSSRYASEGIPSQRLRTGEDEVAWDVLGDGPPVVLVHGFPTSAYVWRRVAPDLAERGHRVFVLDLPGFGASTRGEHQRLWFDGQAEVLARLLEAWDLPAPVLVGHDMGGGTVVQAVVRGLVGARHVVLVDPAITPPAVTGATQHVQEHLAAYASMPAATWRPLVRAKLRTATHTPMPEEVVEAHAAPWTDDDGQRAYLRFVAQIDDDLVRSTFASLSDLHPPVSVLWGEEDTWLPVAQAEAVASRVPDLRALHVVPGGGHFLPEDAPAAVARFVDRAATTS